MLKDNSSLGKKA